jgi:hypothetical protein
MAATLATIRTWLERRYRQAGLAQPGLRQVRRDDARSADPDGAALLVEDGDLRQYLLILDLAGLETPEALAARITADLEAAWALRSACLPGNGAGLAGGEAAWRVRVHWLGADQQQSAWRAAILHARQSGGLLDELPVDATFLAASETLEACLDRTGLPGLLLTTRALFAKDAAATDLWASADQRVRAAVAGLEAALAPGRCRAIARELMVLADLAAPAAPPAAPPRRLRRLAVAYVRGIRGLTLDPWPGDRPVQSWVLSGPNGSGKSSLAEAVALQAFGASRGLCAYLRDPDVSRARTPAAYLARYLTPLTGGTPRCGFDGEAEPCALVPDLAAALQALAEAEGTLAAQGDPAGFLDTPGDELGARMARSFSALATRLASHLEIGRQAAAETRTALARKHGISTATRLPATFQEKIARAQLGAALAPLPATPAAFLASLAALPGGAAAAALAATWNLEPQLEAALRPLLRLTGSGPAELREALEPLFADQASRCATLRDCLDGFRAQVAALPAPPLGLAAQAAALADWLDRHPGAEPAAAAPAPALEALLAERAALAEQGRRSRPRHDHLEATLGFLRGHWQEHPEQCPTCGSQTGAPIEATVLGLLAAEQTRLTAQREAYAALTARIRALEPAPAAGAGPACPASTETRRQLQAVTAALLGPGVSAEALLRAPDQRPALIRLLAFAEAPPAPGLAAPASVETCAEALFQAWREADQALAEPEAWEQVAKELTRRLATVVAEHLPATVEALWREIAACLSPAPWLLPAPPRFQARTLRGGNRVEVVLTGPDGGERLARHLLNDAQRNTLGLAWTFCQHLTRGRFQHAWMLLDDPAQDMDQPAFRALCRFLATLLSLYQAASLPFTLILLLNQDDRAMDAARETGQGLIRLGWSGRQEDATLLRIALFGEGARSPQPGDLFTRSGRVADGTQG